jgi:hypothetical protein
VANVVGGAGFAQECGVCRACRHQHERQRRVRGPKADADVESPHPREPLVHDHQVRALEFVEFEPGLGVVRLENDEFESVEHARRKLPNSGVVLDEEDAFSSH